MSIRNLLTDHVKPDQKLKLQSISLDAGVKTQDFNVSNTITVTNTSGIIRFNNIGTINSNQQIPVFVNYTPLDQAEHNVLISNYILGGLAGIISVSINGYGSNQFGVIFRNNSTIASTQNDYAFTYLIC